MTEREKVLLREKLAVEGFDTMEDAIQDQTATIERLERELAEARKQERLAKLCIEEYKKLDRALTDENQALRADAEALRELAVWSSGDEHRTAGFIVGPGCVCCLSTGNPRHDEEVSVCGTRRTLAAAIMEALAKVSP